MKVTEFFIGFGPRIWSFHRGETEYGLKVIPAGAYVRIIGMNNLDEVDPATRHRTYRQQSLPPAAARSPSAGSTMHFIHGARADLDRAHLRRRCSGRLARRGRRAPIGSDRRRLWIVDRVGEGTRRGRAPASRPGDRVVGRSTATDDRDLRRPQRRDRRSTVPASGSSTHGRPRRRDDSRSATDPRAIRRGGHAGRRLLGISSTTSPRRRQRADRGRRRRRIVRTSGS